MKKLDKLRYLLYTVKKLSGCFSSRSQSRFLSLLLNLQKFFRRALDGNADQGVYMICSDGFRHKISEQEIRNAFQKDLLSEQDAMHAQAKRMISLVKQREEHDNISVILICAE